MARKESPIMRGLFLFICFFVFSGAVYAQETSGGFSQGSIQMGFDNRAAIDANASGAFGTGNFWSSTEQSNGDAIRETFSNGVPSDIVKTTSYNVRCVRRD